MTRLAAVLIAVLFFWLAFDVYQAFNELDPPFVGDVP